MRGGGGEGGEVRSRRQLMPSVWILSSISARKEKSIKCPSLFVSVRVLQTQPAAWALSKVCQARFCLLLGENVVKALLPSLPSRLAPQAPSHPPPQTHTTVEEILCPGGAAAERRTQQQSWTESSIGQAAQSSAMIPRQTSDGTQQDDKSPRHAAEATSQRDRGAVDVSGLYNTHTLYESTATQLS